MKRDSIAPFLHRFAGAFLALALLSGLGCSSVEEAKHEIFASGFSATWDPVKRDLLRWAEHAGFQPDRLSEVRERASSIDELLGLNQESLVNGVAKEWQEVGPVYRALLAGQDLRAVTKEIRSGSADDLDSIVGTAIGDKSFSTSLEDP